MDMAQAVSGDRCAAALRQPPAAAPGSSSGPRPWGGHACRRVGGSRSRASSGRAPQGRSLMAGAASIQLVAVPGPLFISEGFDRDRLRDSKTSLQHSSFLQFPHREDAAELRRTPPLVR